MTTSALSAAIQDVQDVRLTIAQESTRYRAQHFPGGSLPPKHDWRPAAASPLAQPTPPAVPGGVGYGYYFYDPALLWTNSTVADYYVIAPNVLGQDVSYLYLTSTCRARLGTESLVEYDAYSSLAFWIYDWAQPAANRWQVFMNLPIDHPEYLTRRPDEFAITRQMVHVRNGTYYLGFAQGQYQWQNRVWLFNFNRAGWDLIYSSSYGTTHLTDNLFGAGVPTGYWGPIVETFDTYTNIHPVGFDLIRLFQDNQPDPCWLSATNSYVVMSSPWQLLTQAPNTGFTIGVNATNPPGPAYSLGTLCVTATTNAASFTLSSTAGTVASDWVLTPPGNRWEKIVVGLPTGSGSITFNALAGLSSPAPQSFLIAANQVTSVPAGYYFPPPNFRSVTAAAGSVNLSWDSVPGLSYQLQYTTNLNPPDWAALGSPLVASNAVLSASDPFGSAPQRFYRVQQP